jgi:EAL domain-containing protein (putative c-di-GMP-specific phosphodiesterase class I)
MNILDENIPEDQRQLLRGWRIPARQIGHEVGRSGMQDGESIPLLHQWKARHSSLAISDFTIALFAMLITASFVWL